MSEADLAKYFNSKRTPYVKPLYSINISSKDAVLSWFRDAEEALSNFYRPLFREQRENLSFFLGSGINPNYATPAAATFASIADVYDDTQQIHINEMWRVTMAQVSLIISNELVPEVLPNSEDYSDKVACNVVKEWLESMNYDLDTEAWRFRWELQKKIFGEAFCIVMWDPNIGDIHPDAKRFAQDDMTLLDEDGNPIINLDEQEIKINKHIRVGDIDFINPMPWNVMIDPQPRYKDSCWFFWKEYLDVEYLKKEYPKYRWEDFNSEMHFDAYSNTEKDDPNRRCIYYLYHRSHKLMPEGRFIVSSKGHVLINEPLRDPTMINNQNLPLVRFMDTDTGFNIRGVPMLYRNCRNLAGAYNRITNQAYNNLEMESPTMFVHQDADVDAQRMPNGIKAVEWTGHVKPTIETPTSNTPSIFNFREQIKKNIDEMALQTPMVRGDTPNAQLDSFVALQHFEDQRVQLASPEIKSHIHSMEDLYRLMITRAKDNYKPDDGRLIKILGKHNTTQLKYFDPINLEKSYDVKISTTGNLANSKAARTQMMISIKRDFPEMLTNEVFLDMLGLSHSKKFMSAITAAVSAAEAENQSMYSGEEVLSPTRYEDLITHWETHRIPMQTLDFKQSPPEIQERFIAHVAATEKLMFEQASESPPFDARLQTLRQFPMFYMPIPVNEPPPIPPEEEGLSPPPGPLPPELPPI